MISVIEIDTRPGTRPAIQYRIPCRTISSWISERECMPRSLKLPGVFFYRYYYGLFYIKQSYSNHNFFNNLIWLNGDCI